MTNIHTLHAHAARLLSVLLASLLLSACPMVYEEDPSAVKLEVELSYQETQVWCWAAVSEMILQYDAHVIDQCQIVGAYLGYYNNECCYYPQYCQTTAPIETIQRALFYYGGMMSYLYPSALTFDQVVLEIDAGRPIVAGYTGSFIGHVVIIYGYDAKGQLYIHDPSYGSLVVPYASTFTYGGQLYWSATIMDIQ